MQWFRSKPLGSWCAIFALAIQLLASFGHVHRGGTMRPFAVSFFAVTVSHLWTTAAPTTGRDLPKPIDLGLGYCAVCTVVALAGTLLPPASPELPLPEMVGAAGHWATIDFASMPLRHFIFQARAPPQARIRD